MRGVAADDVNDGFGQANGRWGKFAIPGALEKVAVEEPSVGFEEGSRAGDEVESFGVVHEERDWSMLREQPRGRAPGSRPMRVKEPSSFPMAKSWVRIAATLWTLARS